MTKTVLCSLGLAAAALAGATLAAATPGASVPQQTSKPAEDPGAALLVRMCNDCHDSTRVVSPRRTRTDWADVITQMIEKGATGSEREFETVFDYLVRTYGKVFINAAKADEIATVLGLSKKDAEAIVAFRTANGPFADFAALKKVPDLDVKKLEEHKDAVAF
jgi:competence ComEA-like helix-hairpin-helix protein